MRIGTLSAVCLLAVIGAWCGDAQFTLTPSVPILNAPVKAVAADTSLTSVFLSSDTGCTARLTTDQVVSSSTHAVTFYLPSTNVTNTYICRSSDSLKLFDLIFYPITFSPKFIFRGAAQTFTFSSNAEVGATIFLQEFSDCVSGGTGMSQVLNSQRKATGTVSVSYTYYMCIRFTSAATGSTVTVNLGNALSIDTAIFSPSTTIRYDSVKFEVSGSARANANIIIASDSLCEVSVQGPVTTDSSRQATFAVTAVKGLYYLCVDASNIYYPAGPITVYEYIVTPRTIFKGVSVPMKLSTDIASPTKLGFISNADCTNPLWIDGPATVTGGTVDKVFNTVATYYSCILKPGTVDVYVRASEHTVVEPYTATIDRGTNIVRGLSFLVTVSPHAELFVSLVMGTSCSNTPFISGASVLYKFSGIIPLSGTYTGGTMAVCLQTQDGSYTYPVATASVRDFTIAFEGGLIENVQTQVTIDTALQIGTNSAYKITQGSMDCSQPTPTGLGEFSPLPVARWLTFPSTGTYTFCARTFNATYVALTNLLVFTLPTATPNSTFAGIGFTATFVNVPVGVIAGIGSANCTTLDYNITRTAAMTNVVFSNIVYTVGASKALCIYYPSTYGNTQPYVVGSLAVSLVVNNPNKAFLGQTTRFALVDVDPYLLVNGRGFITTGGPTACQNAIPSTTYPVLFARPLEKPYISLPMPSSITTVNLCVGGNTQASSTYISTGTITTLEGVSVVFDPSAPVINIPFNMEFISQSGGTISTKYRISKAEDGCAGVVVEGPLVAMRTTSSITVISEDDYNICIEVDTDSYLAVTTLRIGQLVASPATYVRFMSTELRSSPSISGLFLTSRADCGGTRYTATVASPLNAPVGDYQMCAIISGISAASSNRVNVINQYIVSLPDRNTIRSFVPFNVTITGGDVSGRSVPVYFIPAVSATTGYSNECINTTYTSTEVVSKFNSTMTTPMTVAVNGKDSVLYRMCVVTADGTSSVQLATLTPNPYMVPSSLVKGLPVTITSGGSSNGYALISPTADCATPYLLGPIQLVNYLWDNATISASETRNVSYYCEAPSSLGVYTYRGTMNLVPLIAPTLPPPSTYAPTDPVGFQDRYFNPAVPITLSVPAESGYNPFVSHFHDCSDVMVVTNGIVPRDDEVSSYYVCATTPDGTLNYSRSTPNLHIYKYVITPIVGQSSVSVAISITPPTKTSSVYFSSNSNCIGGSTVGSPNYLGAATGFNAGIQVLATTHIGVVYVCNIDVASTNYIPVSTYLSVGLPVAQAPVLTPIKGVPWCLTRTVPGNLFSLVQDGDTTSIYAKYYASTDRRSFLVTSGTACDVAQAVAGTTYTQATEGGELCVQTTALTAQSYRLCTGTPYGFAIQAEETVAVASPSPSTFVTGTYTEAVFPGMPNRSFLFVVKGQACSLANSVVSPFTTDVNSIAQVSTVPIATGVSVLTPGNYTLCAKLDQNSPSSAWGSVLDAVPIVRQQLFGLNFTSLTAGVATNVPLLYDLRGSAMRNTLSPVSTTSSITSRRVTVSACGSTLATSIGYINTTSDESVASITVDVPGTYVVCALTDVNDTMVAVATITVVSPILEFAPSAAACDRTAVTYLRTADAATTQATDIYLNADACCGLGNVAINNPSRQLQVVSKPSTSASNQGLRTVEVTDTQLSVFYPQTSFRMCLSNATMCLDTGYITFTGSLCASTASTTGGPSNHVGGASPLADSVLDDIPLTLLIILFCLLLLVVVIICVICICCCRNRVTPKDEADEEDDDEEAGEWKRSHNAMLAKRTGDESHGIVDVPIDMHLDICSEPPLEAQDEEVEEDRQRAIIEHYEEELRQELYAKQAAENADIDDWDAAQDRERVSRSLMKAVRVPYSDEVVADEEDRRLELEELEDNARLNIAEMERELWRHQMDSERNLLQQQLEVDPYWRSRRRQLREANDRALTSINTVAVQHNSVSHPFSPSRRSISPVKAHPSERMYQGTNRSSSGLVSPSRGHSAVSIPLSPLDPPSRRAIPSNVEEETFIDDNGGVTASRSASSATAAYAQAHRSASNRAVDPHAVW